MKNNILALILSLASFVHTGHLSCFKLCFAQKSRECPHSDLTVLKEIDMSNLYYLLGQNL